MVTNTRLLDLLCTNLDTVERELYWMKMIVPWFCFSSKCQIWPNFQKQCTNVNRKAENVWFLKGKNEDRTYFYHPRCNENCRPKFPFGPFGGNKTNLSTHSRPVALKTFVPVATVLWCWKISFSCDWFGILWFKWRMRKVSSQQPYALNRDTYMQLFYLCYILQLYWSTLSSS